MSYWLNRDNTQSGTSVEIADGINCKKTLNLMSQSANYIFFCISWDFTLFHCRKAPLRKKGLYIVFMNCNYSSYTQGIQERGREEIDVFFLWHIYVKSHFNSFFAIFETLLHGFQLAIKCFLFKYYSWTYYFQKNKNIQVYIYINVHV